MNYGVEVSASSTAGARSSPPRSRTWSESSRGVPALCDNRLTMPEANRSAGDPKLARLFDEFGGRMVSPGGAAALLGLSRQTMHTLCKRDGLRACRSDDEASRELRTG